MTTTEIIKSKVSDMFDPISHHSGFSDEFNNVRVLTHRFYHNGTVVVSIKGKSAKEFNTDNENIVNLITEYIISNTLINN